MPAWAGQPFGALRHELGTGGHDEHLVVQGCAVPQKDPLVLGLHSGGAAEPQLHPGVQQALARALHLFRTVVPEGNEQKTWLIQVHVVAVNDRDGPAGIQALDQLVGHHAARCSAAQNDDAFHGDSRARWRALLARNIYSRPRSRTVCAWVGSCARSGFPPQALPRILPKMGRVVLPRPP